MVLWKLRSARFSKHGVSPFELMLGSSANAGLTDLLSIGGQIATKSLPVSSGSFHHRVARLGGGARMEVFQHQGGLRSGWEDLPNIADNSRHCQGEAEHSRARAPLHPGLTGL